MNNGRERWQGRAGVALKGWRTDLSHEERAGDRAALGRLAAPGDAMLLACFAELCNRAMGAEELDAHRIEALARCAFLAGRLSRFEDGASLAAAMARRQGSRRPPVSPVRASALFSLEDADQACLMIGTMLGTLGGRTSACLDPLETLRAMSNWDWERRRIALGYHRANAPQQASAGPAAPDPQAVPDPLILQPGSSA